MSAYVSTPSYALYNSHIRPALSVIAHLTMSLAGFIAIALALKWAAVQNIETADAELAMIFVVVGLASAMLVVMNWLEGTDESWPLTTYPVAGALLSWSIVGICLLIRDPLLHYDRNEIRVLTSRQVLGVGESVNRGVLTPLSYLIDAKKFQGPITIEVPNEKRLRLSVRYGVDFKPDRGLVDLLQKVLDKSTPPASEVAQRASAELATATASLIADFVRAEGINAVGRDIPHTISYLGRVRIDEITIRP